MTVRHAAFGIVLVALSVVSCSSSSSSSTASSSELRAPTNGEPASDFGDTKIGQSIVVPMGPLCTTGDPITITKVEAWSPTGGMRVTSWGTRYIGPGTDVKVPNQGGITGEVEQIVGFSTTLKIRAKCNDKIDDTNQFDVSVSATSPRATMRGVVVRYGDGRKVNAHMGVLLCEASSC